MRTYQLTIIAAILLTALGASAHVPTNWTPGPTKTNKAQYRDLCAASTSQIDQEINNVRARLLGGGDCWWDFSDGRYIVPKVDVTTGQREVSSLFAGSVWLGGVDLAGNLKLACQDYRAGGANDFWPGPLTDIGLTDAAICKNWDRHFRVTGEEIRQHLRNLSEGVIDDELIPRGVRGWPAQGNPFFTDVYGFDLPNSSQGLAGFFDANLDGIYNPLDGDYPSIEIRGCALDRYPDEMIFWVYNDEGGGQSHAITNGNPIRMEVQVQAFSYLTNDELNDMTFQRYKLINRATEVIDSTFFAMWADPDLGCHTDDFIGCDTTLSLMYVYNEDATDGSSGCTCDGDVATYCSEVPILGIDYFRGPIDPDLTKDTVINGRDTTLLFELGMSSFTYYNNSIGPQIPGTLDPNQDFEFYNYITGRWRDGTPYTYGGTGYNSGGQIIKYAFPDPPNSTGWTMCNIPTLVSGDRRTLQASGPFRLEPGATNELIIGVPWVPNQAYPCPDLDDLYRADRLAQGLFDACFDRLDGPDAPDVDWIELDEQVVAVLSNDPIFNNEGEGYVEADFLADSNILFNPDPAIREKANFRFQGYLIYQLINANVSASDYDDATRARLVYQVDLRDSVADLYNWEPTAGPNGTTVYTPVLMVDANNSGIRHTFPITEDQFATGEDRSLINHKKYYYSVVAYAFNEYSKFDPFENIGQKSPFLPSSRNIQIYTVIPRPIVDRALQASYGDGVVITRLEGVGAGGNFLDLNQETRDRIFNMSPDTALTYVEGRGPLNVTIFNPFEVKNGDYEIRLIDDNMTDKVLADNARWELRNLQTGEVVLSERSLSDLNEQIVKQYGFSVTINQTPDAGDFENFDGGGIGAELEMADPNDLWLFGIPDDEATVITGTDINFHWVKTNKLEEDYAYDPTRSLSLLGNGWFVPYPLADWRVAANDQTITPAWTEANNRNSAAMYYLPLNDQERRNLLNKVPNVDIVMTKDKSKWSRCVVIETASIFYSLPATYPPDPLTELKTESIDPARPRLMFDVRGALSVGKYDANNDGRPDPDGAVDANGNPIYGMGWFPGYAVDVETGRRLNVFFGENSAYHTGLSPTYTGRDMLWNPTDQIFRGAERPAVPPGYYDFVMGGQHWVYVTSETYDGCEALRLRLDPSLNSYQPTRKLEPIRKIAWTGMLMLRQGEHMQPLGAGEEGLIPNDTRIKLRVDNPFQPWFDEATGQKNGHPRYQFKIENREWLALNNDQVNAALDSVKVVPNPYYGYSQYETSQFSNVVKITNLPAKCTVTIYSLDGKFIRQYQRNEQYSPYNQIAPDLEWDLKNRKGIQVASGVYLIHVNAPGMGERTIKWFGVGRQFDPAGL
jgi:hypothetical protein